MLFSHKFETVQTVWIVKNRCVWIHKSVILLSESLELRVKWGRNEVNGRRRLPESNTLGGGRLKKEMEYGVLTTDKGT